MFVVLQMEKPIGYSLLEAIVEIRDKDICYQYVSEAFTERMICAGTPYGGRGPLSVSDYSTNKFVCEIMVIHSDIKICFNIPQKRHFKNNLQHQFNTIKYFDKL